MGRGGRRGRGGEGGRGDGGGFQDQYGDAGMSQDRDEHMSFGGRGGASGGRMGGGGDAGGGRHGSNVNFVRHVPKFLQGHMHLLGKPQDTAEEQLAAKKAVPDTWDSKEDDEAERQDALRRAVAQDPSLVQQYPELASHVAKNEAEAAKELGNKAFSEKKYVDAVANFSKCIALDKSNEIYYSNRAAALSALKRYSEALDDAKTVIRLKPSWAKGWARAGAAHFGLEEWAEAREAYEKGLQLEPDDRTMQEARHKAHINERKAVEAHQHKFKRREAPGGSAHARSRKAAPAEKKARSQAATGVRNKAMLSFSGEDED